VIVIKEINFVASCS